MNGTHRSSALTCVECGAVSGSEAAGWPGYRLDECDSDEPPGVAFYCSACADFEFGRLLPR
jgi:hypothetical protein